MTRTAPDRRADAVHDSARVGGWWRAVVAIGRDTADRVGRVDLMLTAAGLTFYAGIAVVPLLLLGLYGAGLLLGPDRVADLVLRLSEFTPATLGVRDLVQMIGAGAPRLGVSSLIASILTATTYGEGLLRAVDSLEGSFGPRRTIVGRLRVLPYLGVFPLVTMLGLATVAMLPDMLGSGVGSRLLGVYVTFWVGWLSAAALVGVLYRLFAQRSLRWPAIVWSALATGSFLAGMSLGWVLVLRFGVAVGRAYGGSEQIGLVVLVSIYLLFVQVAVLVGYLLAQSIDDHINAR